MVMPTLMHAPKRPEGTTFEPVANGRGRVCAFRRTDTERQMPVLARRLHIRLRRKVRLWTSNRLTAQSTRRQNRHGCLAGRATARRAPTYRGGTS
jgi:hypothetical protein